MGIIFFWPWKVNAKSSCQVFPLRIPEEAELTKVPSLSYNDLRVEETRMLTFACIRFAASFASAVDVPKFKLFTFKGFQPLREYDFI